jgi:hypothetical protein
MEELRRERAQPLINEEDGATILSGSADSPSPPANKRTGLSRGDGGDYLGQHAEGRAGPIWSSYLPKRVRRTALGKGR